MQSEIHALERNHTQDLLFFLQGRNLQATNRSTRSNKSLWSTERNEVRLVISANTQGEGLDYHETSALVPEMVTMRTLLAIFVTENWAIHQMDVHNAFLYGDLTKKVYTKLPPGISHGHPGQVCHLKKSLYGLKQAPRYQFAKLTEARKQSGFQQSYADGSLFTYTISNIFMCVLVYVDVLIITRNDSTTILSFRKHLTTCFHMKDLRLLKYG